MAPTTRPRRPRAAALAVSPERPSMEKNEKACGTCSHSSSYVLSGTLLALIFLTFTVFLFMLFPFFMPARTLLSSRAKMNLCTDFMRQMGKGSEWSSVVKPGSGQIKKPTETVCTTEYRPVCGETQVQCIKAPCPPIRETYSNSCEATKAGATVVAQGACAQTPEEMVKIISPLADQKISSPVMVKGMAFGGWFFEGSFPIQITDAAGTVLGEAPAVTTEDWAKAALAGEKIGFTAKITFKKTTAKQGYIVLKQDNPSGLPENDHEVKIPVNF